MTFALAEERTDGQVGEEAKGREDTQAGAGAPLAGPTAGPLGLLAPPAGAAPDDGALALDLESRVGRLAEHVAPDAAPVAEEVFVPVDAARVAEEELAVPGIQALAGFEGLRDPDAPVAAGEAAQPAHVAH